MAENTRVMVGDDLTAFIKGGAAKKPAKIEVPGANGSPTLPSTNSPRTRQRQNASSTPASTTPAPSTPAPTSSSPTPQAGTEPSKGSLAKPADAPSDVTKTMPAIETVPKMAANTPSKSPGGSSYEDASKKTVPLATVLQSTSLGKSGTANLLLSNVISNGHSDEGQGDDVVGPMQNEDKTNWESNNKKKERRRSSMVSSHVYELVKLHFSDVENRLFEMFGNKQTKTINVRKFLAGLLSTGLRADDPRLSEMYENVQDVKRKINKVDDDSLVVDYHTFMGIISENLEIVVRAFSHSFIIPEFRSFCDHVDVLYDHCRGNNEGRAAEYIPQLSRMSTDFWAVSLCTVDGQRYSVGDVKQPFTIQSCSKPLTYAVACADNGPDKMHKFIGLEPSGRFFNELCLDYKNKPHNPMINSGAIMTAALVKPEFSAADRFDYMFEMYKRLAGGEYLGFNNSVFLSEKECADRNFALAYFMRENKCFPTGTKLQETLEFYFQLCSLEITAESGAVMAATLANGGINPLTGDPVLTCEAVRNTLTLMHSCGMYNYSGQFAFKVGLPAKSGVSGCVLLVVPNTIGICLWSPALDVNGNSCRGVQFCSELVNLFRFHHFDNLRGNSSTSTKIDPRVTKTESSAQILFDLLFCVAANDISSLRRHALAGTDLESADYDGRTALHVAASEGHVELVEFLLEKCQVNPAPKDRWQRTPLDDARNFGHPLVEKLLVKFCRQRGIAVPDALVVEKVNGTTKAAGVNQ